VSDSEVRSPILIDALKRGNAYPKKTYKAIANWRGGEEGVQLMG